MIDIWQKYTGNFKSMKAVLIALALGAVLTGCASYTEQTSPCVGKTPTASFFPCDYEPIGGAE